MSDSHDLQFVYKGDRLTADQVNAIIRAAQHHPPCKHVPHDPPWYNDAATACPEYGIAAVTGTTGDEGDKMAKCAQPTTPAAKQYIVNIDDELDAADEGNYQNGEWVLALYDDAVDTPAFEEVWGPETDQWYLTKGAASTGWGILVAGIVDSDEKILLGKIIGDDSDGIFYGEVQSITGGNADGTANRTVVVKACDIDGTAVGDQTDFNVKTPLKSNAFTDLTANDVVGYMIDADGEKVIVTDCWATAEGTNWIGVENYHRIYHKTPKRDVEADPAKLWFMPLPTACSCGIVWDDAGNFVGYYDGGATWRTPWDIDDPTLCDTHTTGWHA
jgi:hypothetical protein